MERKVPMYGPYLQVLFERTWDDTFEADYPFPAGVLTKHGVVELRIKERWTGGHGHAQAHPVASDEEIEEEETAAGGEGVPRTRSGVRFGGAQSSPQSLEQPGWAAKLTRKVKKLFCLQTNVQHR